MLNKINNKTYLKDEEIVTLSKYGIKVNSNTTYDEILFLINNILNDLEDEDEAASLDYVAKDIAERKYYNNINK